MASSSKKSAGEANLFGKRNLEDDLLTKPVLKKHKETSEEKEETTKTIANDSLQQKSDQANLISVKETVKGLDDIPDFVEATEKTLYVSRLSRETKISDIIDFFKDVGQVVRVRLIVNHTGKHSGNGFVEFASANQAKKAKEKKYGEYLHGHRIFLYVANPAKSTYLLSKYCIDHKVWYDDYLGRESFLIEEDEAEEGRDYRENLLIEEDDTEERLDDRENLLIEEDEAEERLDHRESLLIEEDEAEERLDHRESLLIEEDEAQERLDGLPDSIEKVLFVANLSPQTKISDIKGLFKYIGVVSVRLIVNNKGKHVGYGFVEFASPYRANKALEERNREYLHGHQIFLMKINGETPDYAEAAAVEKKTLFISHLSPLTEISHIINFFKDVGEVVHVRLIVSNKGRHVGYGFVEFASANEAEKALEKKNGEVLDDSNIVLEVVEAPYRPPKYCIDYKVWDERESLMMEDKEAVKGLDETPDFVEPFAVTKKTLSVSCLSHLTRISDIVSFFKDVGEVVRVRLIVDHKSEHVGCGFIEFASADEAQKALEKKNGERLGYGMIVLDVAEISPYPLRPKYDLVEKHWYEDKLRGESLDLEPKPYLKKWKIPKFCGKKIVFSDDLSLDLETKPDVFSDDLSLDLETEPEVTKFCGKKTVFAYDD